MEEAAKAKAKKEKAAKKKAEAKRVAEEEEEVISFTSRIAEEAEAAQKAAEEAAAAQEAVLESMKKARNVNGVPLDSAWATAERSELNYAAEGAAMAAQVAAAEEAAEEVEAFKQAAQSPRATSLARRLHVCRGSSAVGAACRPTMAGRSRRRTSSAPRRTMGLGTTRPSARPRTKWRRRAWARRRRKRRTS